MSYWNLESADSGQAKRINEVFMTNCSRWKWCHQKYSSFLFYFFSLLNVCMGIIAYISIQGMLVFVNCLESYRSSVPDLLEQKSEFLFTLVLGLEKENFKGKKKVTFLSPTAFPFSVWKSLIQAWKYLFIHIMLLERPKFFICYRTRACQWGYLDHNVKMPWCPPESCCRK